MAGRKKYKEPRCLIPPALVPTWLLGMPLDEWIITHALPKEEAEAMLLKIRVGRNSDNDCEKALT
jgi:hypothetical protein